MAERLGISPSYLNLIESNRRPLPAGLLIKLAQGFGIDLPAFGGDDDARDDQRSARGLLGSGFRRLPAGLDRSARYGDQLPRSRAPCWPCTARTRPSACASDELASRLDGEEQGSIERSQLPTEEVNDLIQAHLNYFPQLEEGAEELWRKGKLEPEELYASLVRYLERQHGVQVRIARGGAERDVLRRYEPDGRC